MFQIVIVGIILWCAKSQAYLPRYLEQKALLAEVPAVPEDISKLLQGDVSVTEHYITQLVDHFNPQDNRTFQMVNITAMVELSTNWTSRINYIFEHF